MRLNKNIYDDICIRKIINKIIIISLIALVISTLGCKSSSVGDKAGQYNFKQGVAELKLSLLDNAPPEKIYPNSNFKIVVEVDNPSAYDITDGRINIVGIDEKYFQVYPFEQNINFLEGRNLANPSGDKTFIEFDGTAGQLFQNAEEYTANFFLMAKYRSKVEFVDTVCISPNFYDVYDSGCKVEGKKSYSGQG
ncbi:MAG: hypothetical protein KJ580_04000, partial [Nanoarchaeota archaeon]|nr:hypothetical protein [Nanoarchaeota archaeon]